MNSSSSDGGSQLILDNRKLIIAFVLLMVICGSFFVIGFMEGKRQGIQRAGERQAESFTTATDFSVQKSAAKTTAPQSEPRPAGDKTVPDNLDWYSSVNKRGNEPVKGLEPPKAANAAPGAGVIKAGPHPPTAPTPTSNEPKSKPPAAVAASKTTYSVQVGAFRQRKEAEAKAAMLKAKRYNYVIEPSGAPDQLFLLKVGKYDSRAEAVAMQNRLKKDGFNTFIKTNK